MILKHTDIRRFLFLNLFILATVIMLAPSVLFAQPVSPTGNLDDIVITDEEVQREARQNQSQTTATTPATTDRGLINGLIPCGRRGDASQDPAAQPCTACHALLAGKNLLDYLTSIMVVVAIAVIVAMGVLYIISGVNTGLKETAKKGLTAVLVGLIFMLSAWLIVSTLLRFLASDDFTRGGGGFIGLSQGEGVYGLQCNTASQGGRGQFVEGRITARGAGSGGSGAGNGTCSVLRGNNACSVENLSRTCFGAEASRMSQVCNLESAGGQVNIRSGSDVCGNYGRRSFSGGLFQINIFAHGARLGSDCANLGSKGSCVTRRGDVCLNWSCNIPDVARFDRCMQRTLTAEGNIQIACAISNNGANRTPWACSANRCGVGGTTSNFCR